MWGVFVLCVLSILVWWLLRRWQAKRAAAKADAKKEHNHGPDRHDEDSLPRQESPEHRANGAASAVSKEPWWGVSALWKRRSVRRAVFLCRFAWLLADFSLDISLTVWLFANGEGNSGVVCAVFIGLAQVAITLVAFFNLVPLLFGSICGLLLMSPIMLAIMPVLAPIMAVWNAINPDIPLVFWR